LTLSDRVEPAAEGFVFIRRGFDAQPANDAMTKETANTQ
jgi:hypothetical protein